jgi:hypothetical protein
MISISKFCCNKTEIDKWKYVTIRVFVYGLLHDFGNGDIVIQILYLLFLQIMSSRDRANAYARRLKTSSKQVCKANVDDIDKVCVISHEPIEESRMIVVDKKAYDIFNLYKWIMMRPTKQTIPHTQNMCKPEELACIIHKMPGEHRDIAKEQECIAKHATVTSDKHVFDADLSVYSNDAIANELRDFAMDFAKEIYEVQTFSNSMFKYFKNEQEIVCVLFVRFTQSDSTVVRSIYKSDAKEIIITTKRVVIPDCLANNANNALTNHMGFVTSQMEKSGYHEMSVGDAKRGGNAGKYKYKGRYYKIRIGKRGGRYIRVKDRKIYV